MRILALDIGSTAFKALELESAFGRYEVYDHHEWLLEPETQLAQLTQQFLSSRQKKPDRLIVSLPTQQTTFRQLQIPTRDKKAITSSLQFELDDELPFPLSEAAFEMAILSQEKNRTSLHAAVSLKKHLAKHLLHLNELGIEPDVVTTEAWAFRTLCNRLIPQEAQSAPHLLIHMGARRTLFYVHWQGAPLIMREAHWGGETITETLATQRKLTLAVAEAQKKDQGLLTPLPDPELLSSLQFLINEILKLNLISKTLTLQSLKLISLSGGSSLLPGLGEWIERRLRIPTQPLLALSRTAQSGVSYSETTDASLSLAMGLALSWVGAERHLCINFRRGDFAKAREASRFSLKELKAPLRTAGALFLLFLSSMLIESFFYQARLNEVQKKLKPATKNFFGDLSNSALNNYTLNPASLKKAVELKLAAARELKKLTTSAANSPLHFLRILSSTLPKDLVLELELFQVGTPVGERFDPEQTQEGLLTFALNDAPQVARLAKLIEQEIPELNPKPAEEINPPQGEKKWKSTFSGKIASLVYGK